MSINVLQIRDLQRISFLSKNVFDLQDHQLPQTYDKILRYMVYKDDPEQGATIQEITKHLKQYNIDWHTVKKRLVGTSKTMGLVPMGFVIEKYEGKGRGGNNNFRYHLSFKGILASLSTGISIEQLFFYKNYINYLQQFVNDDGIVGHIQNYIKNEIKIFLLMNHLTGIIIRNVTNFNYYYKQFFATGNIFDTFYSNFKFLKINPPLEIRKMESIFKKSKENLEKLGINRVSAEGWPHIVYDALPQSDYEIEDPFDSDKIVTVDASEPETNPLKLKVKAMQVRGLDVLIFEYPTIMEWIDKEKDNFSLEKYLEHYKPKFSR